MAACTDHTESITEGLFTVMIIFLTSWAHLLWWKVISYLDKWIFQWEFMIGEYDIYHSSHTNNPLWSYVGHVGVWL